MTWPGTEIDLKQAPRPVLRRLNAGKASRSPWGTAMLAASSREHIAKAGRLGSGRALGPLSTGSGVVISDEAERSH
jgi:hypothetical protein